MLGVIKSFSNRHGYGFIRCNGVEYLFKKRAWRGEGDPQVGATVNFLPVKNEKGPRAIRVYEAKERQNGNL